MTSTFPLVKFISLHRMLLFKMLLLDFMLGVLGSIFLLVPLNDFALSPNNLSFLVLLVFLMVAYQIHIFRTYSGGVAFYLNLPVEKYRLLSILLIETIIPLSLSLSITAIVLMISQMFAMVWISFQWVILKKCYYMVLTFFMLKTIALPIFILYKRHIALILLFLIFLVMIYALISIIAELMHIPGMVFGFILFGSVEAVCIRIVMSAKIN